MEFVDALLELVLQLVNVFFLLLEVLVIHILLELKALELLMDLALLLQLLSRLLLLKARRSLQVLGFVLLLGLWFSDFFLSLIQVLKRLLSSLQFLSFLSSSLFLLALLFVLLDPLLLLVEFGLDIVG